MSIQKFLLNCEKRKVNSKHDELIFEFNTDQFLRKALEKFGEQINNFKAVPPWSEIDVVFENLAKYMSEINVVVDESGDGLIEISPSISQKDLINKLKENLITYASKHVSASRVESAIKEFDSVIELIQFTKEFNQQNVDQELENFMLFLKEYDGKLHHKVYGPVTIESLKTVAKQKAKTDLERSSEEIDATTVPQQIKDAVAEEIKYPSLGAMLKANDHKALKKHIDIQKNENKWDQKLQQEAVDTLLFHSIIKSTLDFTKVLVEDCGATLSFHDNHGLNAFMHACSNNQYENVDYLIERFKLDPNEFDIFDRTPLMAAAESDAVDVIKVLVEKYKVNLNEKTIDGRTAFHFATIGTQGLSSYNACVLLMKYNIDPTIRDLRGYDMTAQQYVDESNDELYERIVKYRSDFEAGLTNFKVDGSTASSLKNKFGI